MAFIQIIDFRTDQIDEMRKLDGEWRDRFDAIPYEPGDSYADRLEASLSTWIDHWEDAVAQHPQDTDAAFVVYHH